MAFARAHALSCIEANHWEHLSTPYVLVYGHENVSLAQTGKGVPGPVTASFLNGKIQHRLHFGGGKGQLIAKAVGIKAGVHAHILDTTAGLGRDAFVLASLGQRVTMLERSPLVYELLQCALLEAAGTGIDAIVARMDLHCCDALTRLTESDARQFDVVYLDPMYPERTKSAKVKKEMQAFHEIVGADDDSAGLLKRAMDVARYRVVVKRPRKGELLAGRAPSVQLTGKSSRYDIYTLASMDGLKRTSR